MNALLWLGVVEFPYELPAEAKQALAMPSRVVTQHWHLPGRSNVGQERYNLVTPEFALGSTSAGYGPQDKPIVLELAGSSQLPTFAIVPRAVDMSRGLLDEPYGKREDSSGQHKPTHLSSNPYGPRVLLFLPNLS